jgi:hypothetical protein
MSVETLPAFIPGLELSRSFYEEAVAPILASRYPRLSHAAGLLGTGSETLGFDTPRSMDHWWGPCVDIFLRSEDFTSALRDEIHATLADQLPFEFRGFATHMLEVDRATGTVFMATTDRRPINHRVRTTTVRAFLTNYVGAHPLDDRLTPAQWLAMPEQHLRTIASDGVWHDEPGELSRARTSLSWYPDQLWRYVLRAQWRRIEQEEAFPGRCAEVGDELGSRVVAARLVREIMHLAFQLERQYMPYSKWLGTAFSRLPCAVELQPLLLGVLGAADWPEREEHLSRAYEMVARMHNGLGLTEPVPAEVSGFYGRPFRVIHGDRFAAALDRTITDEEIRRLPPYLGNTTQWADSTDVLSNPLWSHSLSAVYGETVPSR